MVAMRGPIATRAIAIAVLLAVVPLFSPVAIIILVSSLRVFVVLPSLAFFAILMFFFFLFLLLPIPISLFSFLAFLSFSFRSFSFSLCTRPSSSCLAATFLLCFSRVGSQLSTLCSARIRFFCGLCTGDVGAIEDQRTGGGLVAVRKAHAPERWQVTLLRVMAGRLTIKTPLRPTCGRKMILGTTFPACFWLRWVPKRAELASNKGLCWDGSLDRHPRSVNTIEDGVRHAVAPKRNNSTVMAQMVDDNGVGKLVRQLVNFNDGDFVLTVPQKDRTAGNLNELLVQGTRSRLCFRT